MSDKSIYVGRLALRVEGKMWSAYYTLGTMGEAMFLGSIDMRLVQREDRKLQFMALMKNVVADIIETATGIRPDYFNAPEPAPEHERAGNA